MSVINQMLKDLDKRQQPLDVGALPVALSVPSKPVPRPWFVLPLLLAVLLTLSGGWLWLTERLPSDLLQAGMADATKPEANKSEANKPDANKPISALISAPPPAAETLAPAESQASAEPMPTETIPVEPISAEAISAEPLNVEPGLALGKPLQTAAVVAKQPIAKERMFEGQAAEAPTSKTLTSKTLTQETKVSEPVMPAAENMSPMSATAPQEALGQMAVTEVRLVPAAQAARLVTKAQRAEAAGRLDEAATLYGEALSVHSEHHDARRQLAAIHYGQGRVDEAIGLLEAGQLAYPKVDAFALLLAKLWFERADYPRARLQLERIADGAALSTDKYLLLAGIARSTGEHALAERAYAQLLATDSRSAAYWLGLGYAQDALGKWQQASESYRRALAPGGLSQDAVNYIQDRLVQLGGKP